MTVIHGQTWAGPWLAEFPATIDWFLPPEPVQHDQARPGELKYWVTFDRPQYQADGSGPYRKAQIWDRFLKPQVDLSTS
ncbi:hypothetical protein [Actinomadura rupiterrae]|uniref:hypothetical protein n=1 Tax=Actinomadura rupiterrae TaxID=559627 RepID=UPI0020A5B9F4|nr:hypothetical protein [Actinomadura rupiterrae]MCP2337372.1 hypothetical protein [Actinomadura rupiterrae]